MNSAFNRVMELAENDWDRRRVVVIGDVMLDFELADKVCNCTVFARGVERRPVDEAIKRAHGVGEGQGSGCRAPRVFV